LEEPRGSSRAAARSSYQTMPTSSTIPTRVSAVEGPKPPATSASAMAVTPKAIRPSCDQAMRTSAWPFSPLGRMTMAAAPTARPWMAKDQNTQRQAPASANRPPIRGPNRLATPQTEVMAA